MTCGEEATQSAVDTEDIVIELRHLRGDDNELAHKNAPTAGGQFSGVSTQIAATDRT